MPVALADLFGWRPDRRYDVVFFGFWLSHGPTERFTSFWSLVADCLQPDGRVFFVDDGYRTGEELIEGEHFPVIQRRLTDGTAYQIVKVPHQPADLEQQLDRIGWRIKVHPTSGPFLLGERKPPAAGAGCLSEQRPRGSDRGTGVTQADHPLNCHGSATAPSIGSCREALVVVRGDHVPRLGAGATIWATRPG